jgi:hypothetical protein
MSGIKRNLPNNAFVAATNANAPGTVNVFATMADILSGTSGNRIITGNASYSGTGFVYDVSALSYIIQGVFYASSLTSVTLAASDPTNPRIDVILVNDAGVVSVLTGTPAPTPSKPLVDNLTEVEVTFVTVDAASTTPTITIETVFEENAGTGGGEWDATTDGTVDFASVSDPRTGTVSLETTAVLGANKEIIFTPSAPYALSSGQISFWINAKVDMTTVSSKLHIGFFNAGSLVGGSVAIGGSPSVSFGFDGSIVGTYQLVTIPITSFGGLPATVDALRIFKLTGASTSDFFIDDFEIQEGVATTPVISEGLASADQIITDIVRYIDLPGSSSSEYLEIRDNLGNPIIRFSADGQVYSMGPSSIFTNTMFGLDAGASITTGGSNTAFGSGALGNNSNQSFNTAVGFGAGNSANSLGSVYIGYNAGEAVGAGSAVFIGYLAALVATQGNNATIVGSSAGVAMNLITDCTLIGNGAGRSLTGSVVADTQIIAIGHDAARGVTNGGASIFIGVGNADIGITGGRYNTVIGTGLSGLTNASNQVIIGDGQGNIAFERDPNGNIILGEKSALATTATDGFGYLRGGAGPPTGVPAATVTGHAPSYWDATNKKLYIYEGGWIASAGGNFADADLTFTANRAHNTAGFGFELTTDAGVYGEAFLWLFSSSAGLGFGGSQIDFDSGGMALKAGGSNTKMEVLSTGLSVWNGVDFIFSELAGSKIGTATTQKLSFWNATPIDQPLHIADPAAMAALTGSAPAAAAALTQDALTDNTGGTASTTLADITEANNAGSADRVPTEDALASIAAQLAKISTDISALKTAVDANNAAIDLNITDITAAKTAVDANNAAIGSILGQLAATGLQAAS